MGRCVDHSWLVPVTIDQQNPHKIHLQRAESTLSKGGVIIERTHVWLSDPEVERAGRYIFTAGDPEAERAGQYVWVWAGLNIMLHHVLKENKHSE